MIQRVPPSLASLPPSWSAARAARGNWDAARATEPVSAIRKFAPVIPTSAARNRSRSTARASVEGLDWASVAERFALRKARGNAIGPNRVRINRLTVSPTASNMATDSDKWQPYRHPMPKESPPELVIPDAIPADERIWVPVDDNVWFRPLLLNTVTAAESTA